MPSVVTLSGPGSAIVTDDAGAAILAQTAALSAELVFIDANLSHINANVARIADNSAAIGKAVSDLNAAIGSLAAAQNKSNMYQATMAANQIVTNNFQMAVTKQGLEATGQPVPLLPNFSEMIKTEISNAVTFNQLSIAQGAVTQFINSSIADIGTWIAGTAVYQTVSSWVKSATASLLSIFPSSPKSAASVIKAAAGVKATPE
jgi:hypothetical protein